MHSLWNRLSIVLVILLTICSFISGYLWYNLDITKKQLADTKSQLSNTVAELGNTKLQLADTKDELDDTKLQLTNISKLLDTTKTLLDSTKIQLKTERNRNSQMLDQYSGLKEQVDIRLASTPEDSQSFITPSDSSVSSIVQEITGGYSENVNRYWSDFDKMYRWVVKNITYSYDSYTPILPSTLSGELTWHKGCWQTPRETLEARTGDCEDMAVLLASMLRSYNEGRYRIWVLRIHSSVPEEKGHLAVAFPVKGGNLTILDPAGNYYTGHQYGVVLSETTSTAVKNWLSHWKREMPGAEIVTVFSEDVYEQFSSTDEFLAWLEK